MAVRTADATWQGDLRSGKGTMKVESGAFEGPFSFRTRFEDEPGTNPEELIGAAHAGCYSMAFSNEISKVGFVPDMVSTTAKVHLEGAEITLIELVMEAKIPNVTEEKFLEVANAAKVGCPVSKALASVEITLDATLLS